MVRRPTQIGDVLILRTTRSFTAYVVGLVHSDGQEDFHGQTGLKYVGDRDAAVVAAKALIQPGRRIVIRDLDTDGWSEIST